MISEEMKQKTLDFYISALGVADNDSEIIQILGAPIVMLLKGLVKQGETETAVAVINGFKDGLTDGLKEIIEHKQNVK